MSEEENIFTILKILKKDHPEWNKEPYTIPDNYFITLEDRFLKELVHNDFNESELNSFPLLKSIDKGMSYAVPDKYFVEKEMELHPDIITPFNIENTYFNNLEKKILYQIHAGKIRYFKKWYNLVAAAIITGFIVFGSYQYFRNLPGDNPGTGYAKNIKHMSSAELAAFVDDDNTTTDGYANENNSKKAFNENQYFKNVSNTELQNFLDETGSEDEYTLMN